MKRGKMLITILLTALFIATGVSGAEYDEVIMTALSAPESLEGLVPVIEEEWFDSLEEPVEIYVSAEPLPSGTVIEDWQGEVLDIKAASWFIFADDMPGANWEHPCRYMLIEPGGRRLSIKNWTRPPRMIKRMKKVISRRRERVISMESSWSGGDKGEMVRPRYAKSAEHLWAVIISGGGSQYSNYVRYWNDISSIYKCLVNTYEYLDDHIYVLCSDGLDPAPDRSDGTNSDPDLDGDGDEDIMYSATVDNLQAVFDELSGLIGPQDMLFVYATDHGSSEGGWETVLVMWDPSPDLQDDVFADMLDQVECRDVVTVWEQCYSGGFLDDLHGPNRVFSSAARYDEPSWAMPPEYEYDEYVFYWTAAVNWEDAYGNPVDADANDDGVVDMHEAFLFAEEHDTADETPQYDENPEGYGATVTLWGSGPTSEGALELSSDYFNCDDEIGMTVMDSDLAGTGTLDIEISSSTETEPEVAALTEVEDGVFQGVMQTQSGAPAADGILQIAHEDVITAVYLDEDYGGTGPMEITFEAEADCISPEISDVVIVVIGAQRFTLSWTTNEPTAGEILYGSSVPPAQVAADEEVAFEHEFTVTGLETCMEYFFAVKAVDRASNETVDDNSGAYYDFTTYQIVELYSEPMNTDPGWTISAGNWEFGQPTGQGGEHGDPDPTSGYTGTNVYGYNLYGDYENYMNACRLTSTPVNCSGALGTKLSFYRWLGVESSTYDHAVLDVSNDGTNWDEYFHNSSSLSDGEWVKQTYDISETADGQSTVYIRWTMGPTDSSYVYCGWNIDDMVISYEAPCDAPYLIYESHTVDDSGGNDDGEANPGESIASELVFYNNSIFDATGVTALITTGNPYVAITNEEIAFPDIPAHTSASSLEPHLEWDIDEDAPDGEAVNFEVSWECLEGSGVCGFSEMIKAPVLDYYDHVIDDSAGGNGDGIPDPGESISLPLTLHNDGHCMAQNVQGILSTMSTHIEITDDSAEWPNIGSGGTEQSLAPHFILNILGDAPVGQEVLLNFNISADFFSGNIPLSLIIGARPILVIDDGGGANPAVYADVLSANGYDVTEEAAQDTDPMTWGGYSFVVWSAGDNSQPVSSGQWRSDLTDYTSDGGRLLIEGGEIAYDFYYSDPDFLENVCHVLDWNVDFSGDLSVQTGSHPIKNLPYLLPDIIPHNYSSYYDEDACEPAGDVDAVYGWTSAAGGGVMAYDDDSDWYNGGQVVFYSFTIADVTDETARENLVVNTAAWLSSLSYPVSPTPTLGPATNTPTPTFTSTLIPTSTPTHSPTCSPTITHTSTHTPTQLPTETPTDVLTKTPTYTPPLIPTSIPTSVQTITPYPTAPFEFTATPACPAVELSLNRDMFRSGDEFDLNCRCINPGGERELLLFIVLDIYQEYWFYDDWSQDMDYVVEPLAAGCNYSKEILYFIWPEEAGSLHNLKFWAAFLEPGSWELIGEIDWVEWGFE